MSYYNSCYRLKISNHLQRINTRSEDNHITLERPLSARPSSPESYRETLFVAALWCVLVGGPFQIISIIIVYCYRGVNVNNLYHRHSRENSSLISSDDTAKSIGNFRFQMNVLSIFFKTVV